MQAALASWTGPGAQQTQLVRERDALAARVHRLERELAELRGSEDISAGVTGQDRELVTARVVGIAPVGTPVAARTVTIDAGREHGVRPALTVVSGAGLVGRVLRVSEASSDVLLLGDADVVVGVRFGEEGALGMVEARPAPGLPVRDAGELTLTVVGDSPVTEGDEVVTLGSPDGRPYVAGVPLGTVTRVDPDSGQLNRTAVVEPHVDPDTLDLVAVVLGEG
ncbi:rod shape-determining protein MreC [Ornithinicoccus halotolerans]|uniref:rod shape-determining protein MreC n=1 Tax=Ornithinicoccus halotolerans TaxID=1748220 RepID=UPI001295C929|nr:rod shape-determining protein MreC [Ornithinicoccus halotolerans]